jgi:hypothetical protein
MTRIVQPAVILTAALVVGLTLAPPARAQYRSYYCSSSTETYAPPPGIAEPPNSRPVAVYGTGADTAVNFGPSRSIYYEPGYPTFYRYEKVVLTPPATPITAYYTPSYANRPSYTYTPGYYSYYYSPGYYTPTTSCTAPINRFLYR